jgi:hypothetical protein
MRFKIAGNGSYRLAAQISSDHLSLRFSGVLATRP